MSKSLSDTMSVSASNDINSKNVSSISKKRYKQWSDDEEKLLLELIREKQQKAKELSDLDWSDIATKLSLGP